MGRLEAGFAADKSRLAAGRGRLEGEPVGGSDKKAGTVTAQECAALRRQPIAFFKRQLPQSDFMTVSSFNRFLIKKSPTSTHSERQAGQSRTRVRRRRRFVSFEAHHVGFERCSRADNGEAQTSDQLGAWISRGIIPCARLSLSLSRFFRFPLSIKTLFIQ